MSASAETQPSFRHPGINKVDVSPMAAAMILRRQIVHEADRVGTHPFNVLMEQRLGNTDSALKALEIQQHYMLRDGIVSDLHGLDDDTFGKIRESVLSQRFDRVFFLGDIGGSVALANLQKHFYEDFYNGYKKMKKEGVDDNAILSGLRNGYLDLIAYEKHLESYGHKPVEEIREQAESLTDTEIWEGMQRRGKYVHYGHYVSDQSSELISYLASDVEHYYERFMVLAAELRTTGTRVYVMQGNWDARLPFDFYPGTETAVPLPLEKRRFNAKKFFKEHGIPYFTNIGIVEEAEALNILVPFDSVAKAIDEEGGLITTEIVKNLQKKVRKARRAGKTVSMMTHAVPDWTKHGKLPTGEGEITQRNLQRLVALLNPHELIYGHEHFMRKDQSGNYIDINTKFKLHQNQKGQIITSSDHATSELDDAPVGTVVSFAPKPTEPYNAYASKETPRWPVRNKRPRGAGGKAAPTHVGREVVSIVKIDNQTLPTSAIIFPMGRRS